jgi:hypothetical protein
VSARAVRADHDANANGGAPQADAAPDALEALSDLWTVTITSVERVGVDRPSYYFTGEHRRTDEPVVLGPVSEAELDSPRVMRRRRFTAFGGDRGRLLDDRDHSDALSHVDQAATLRDDGHDDAEQWRERIRTGIADTGKPTDLRDPEHKRNTLQRAFWCFADTDGRAWVHVAGLGQYLRLHKHRGVDDREIAAALTHHGFESQQLTWRTHDGKNRSRRYWRSPIGFTDTTPTDDGAL